MGEDKEQKNEMELFAIDPHVCMQSFGGQLPVSDGTMGRNLL
jgi:hypothetical protein